MKRAFNLLICMICLLTGLALYSGEQPATDLKSLSSEEFLKLVRTPPYQESWAKLSGNVQHRRTGFSVLKSPIRLGVRFMNKRAQAQLDIDGGEEVYLLAQTLTETPQSTIVRKGRALNDDKAKLRIFSLSPQDLLMGFLYTEMLKEEPSQTVSIFPCRVFVMKSPDEGEFTRIYLSLEYRFPVKVEWYKKNPLENPAEKPYRTMEIASVKSKNKFVLPAELSLFGPDWRTKIVFSELDAGNADESVPKDLFLNL